MRESRLLKEGQPVNITDREVMALVEGGTAAIGGVVIGVYESAVVTVRGIVNGVAVGVSRLKVKSPTVRRAPT